MTITLLWITEMTLGAAFSLFVLVDAWRDKEAAMVATTNGKRRLLTWVFVTGEGLRFAELVLLDLVGVYGLVSAWGQPQPPVTAEQVFIQFCFLLFGLMIMGNTFIAFMYRKMEK